MKRLIVRFGSAIACLAMVITTLSANVTCACLAYQPELSDDIQKLRKL